MMLPNQLSSEDSLRDVDSTVSPSSLYVISHRRPAVAETFAVVAQDRDNGDLATTRGQRRQQANSLPTAGSMRP